MKLMKSIINKMILKRKQIVLKFIPFLTLILLSSSCFSQTDRWEKFDKAFKEYIANPTHDNSIKVYDLLPNELEGGDYPEGKIADNIWLTVIKLEQMILKGNRDALKLGFKLFTIADGEYAESLQWTIGKLINKHTKLFLEELKSHRQYLHDVGGLSCNYGPKMWGNTKLNLKETEKRINSLKEIKEEELRNVKNECLMELEDYQKSLSEALIEEEKLKIH